jgi:putative DNA methylase
MIADAHERYRRRQLPHWDLPGATYFITCCLAGSLQARGVVRGAPLPDAMAGAVPGSRWLADRRVAAVVEAAMHHFAGTRYELLAFVIMPDHVHWVFQPLKGRSTLGGRPISREVIQHSFLRYTGAACNRLLGRSGPFWQHESYDRVIRDEIELARVVEYVEHNPVRAGLCTRPEDWRFSSAWRGAKTAG